MTLRKQHCRFLLLLLLAIIMAWPQAALATSAAGSEQQEQMTVVVCVIDGCPNLSLGCLPETAYLRQLCADERCQYKSIEAVFPSSTAAGHAAIFTGTYPERNGVTGKEYLDDDGELLRFKDPAVLEEPTLFHVARSAGLGTAMISAKANLCKMLSEATDFAIWPESVPDWVIETVGPPPDESTQYEDFAGWHIQLDRWVLRTVEAYLEQNDMPVFVGINVGSVDKCGHRFGPLPAAETAECLCSISEGLEELAATLEATRPGRWSLIITADHGMTRVDTGIAARDIIDDITDEDVPITLDGGVLYVWAEDNRGKIADALRQTEGVAEVIEVEDVARRAELHIEHPRTPPLIAVTDRGCMFIEALLFMDYTLGSHGTTLDTDVDVPLIVVGRNADSVDIENVSSITDIASIARELLGI
ncbi:MAG: alkaline phosphatase family protein [Bacillota bacterium]